MPILEVEIVTLEADPILPAGLTQSLADAAARVFSAPQRTVWVKLRVIPPAHYAENGGTPGGVYPVFVTVLRSRVPEGSALEGEIFELTNAIATVLNRPETNVHISYQADGAGRAAFGGKLIR
jgi:phenylpyruvate tautomerase PptA (4-oxalocrotonate tautomerase family)